MSSPESSKKKPKKSSPKSSKKRSPKSSKKGLEPKVYDPDVYYDSSDYDNRPAFSAKELAERPYDSDDELDSYYVTTQYWKRKQKEDDKKIEKEWAAEEKAMEKALAEKAEEKAAVKAAEKAVKKAKKAAEKAEKAEKAAAKSTVPSLPGWEIHYSTTRGKQYYFHPATGKTQWKPPTTGGKKTTRGRKNTKTKTKTRSKR